LIFQPYGADYLVVASKGGADQPPAWYLNLQSNPTVRVQIKDDTFTARARTASPEEKPDMWRAMTRIWPDYDNYQKRTGREIPVVVLERAS
jgi:deazaflavin-dependent oxidoreductase (nitroreductase family)